MSTIVRGLDELAAGLAAEFAKLEGPEMKKALRIGAYAGAAKARDLVRERAPVKSGLLRRSIRAGSARGTGDVLAQAGVYVRAPAFHWRFLELGTVHQPAHPFIRPAFDAGEGAIGDAIADRLSSAIDEALTRR